MRKYLYLLKINLFKIERLFKTQHNLQALLHNTPVAMFKKTKQKNTRNCKLKKKQEC